MAEHIDQMGRKVILNQAPKRIISLVPSQTELLFELGVGDQIVGRTKFCIHPEEQLKEIPIIGGTKKFRMQAIKDLKPDLIIGNKEENYKEGIEELSVDFPVWISDILTINDALDMVSKIGAVLQKDSEASALIQDLRQRYAFPKKVLGKALYLIWRNPWMAAGQDTFINEMLKVAGFRNAIDALRYPELSEAQIKKIDLEFVLLSSEPYPFKEKHKNEIKKLVPKAKVVLVNGEWFSWYGSRILHLENWAFQK